MCITVILHRHSISISVALNFFFLDKCRRRVSNGQCKCFIRTCNILSIGSVINIACDINGLQKFMCFGRLFRWFCFSHTPQFRLPEYVQGYEYISLSLLSLCMYGCGCTYHHVTSMGAVFVWTVVQKSKSNRKVMCNGYYRRGAFVTIDHIVCTFIPFVMVFFRFFFFFFSVRIVFLFIHFSTFLVAKGQIQTSQIISLSVFIINEWKLKSSHIQST